jgi:hypothetical protein
MDMRKNTEDSVTKILDVFTGADGGANFMAFRNLVEKMDARAARGDKDAQQVILRVTEFARLLDVAARHFGLPRLDL